MMEINLDRAAYYQEKMKSAADRMSYGVQELQNVINTIERQEGLEEFVPSLSSALERRKFRLETAVRMRSRPFFAASISSAEKFRGLL